MTKSGYRSRNELATFLTEAGAVSLADTHTSAESVGVWLVGKRRMGMRLAVAGLSHFPSSTVRVTV